MIRSILAAFLLAAATPALAGQATPVRASGPVGESGVLDGVPYRIDIPANWNGGLVVFFHGYRLAGEATALPYAAMGGTEQFTGRGYAVVQSAYSRQGWAVAEARAETRALRASFEQRFGRPHRVFAAGYSMGGHLALATVEQEHERYDGALSLCGANVPSTELIDRAIDNLAAADALFPGIIPNLSAPESPPMFDGQALARAMTADPAATAILADRTGFRARDLPGTMWFYYAIVRELRVRAGGFPGTNGRPGDRAAFGSNRTANARYRRYGHDRAARAYLAANATLTGRLRDPVVILDNGYDDLLSVQIRPVYAADVRRAGGQQLLTVLPPAGEGHCQFQPDQIGTAFDRLIAEVDRRRTP